MTDIVEILLTSDRLENEHVYEAVSAEGYQVRLVQDEIADEGAPAQPAKLLVPAGDVEAVRKIIDARHADADTVSATPSDGRTWMTPPVRVFLTILVILFFIVNIYIAIRDVTGA